MFNYRGEASRMRRVRQGVLAQDAAEAAPADPLRRAPLRLPALRQTLCRQIQHDSASAVAHWLVLKVHNE